MLKRFGFAFRVLLAFAVLLAFTRVAYAQVGAPALGPLASLSPPTLIVAGLGFVLAILTNMVNSGNLFGLLVTPQAWLPYLTLAVTFLGAFVPALSSAEPLTALSWVNAAMAGLTALIAYGAGHAVHANVQAGKVGALKAKAAAKTIAMLVGLVLLSQTEACLPAAAIVPVTPANSQQVSACSTDANTHNALVVGGFVLGGSSTALGAISAIDTSQNGKTAYAIAGAITAGLTAVDAGFTALSASQFASGNCSTYVGPLPVLAKPVPAAITLHPTLLVWHLDPPSDQSLRAPRWQLDAPRWNDSATAGAQ